MAKKAKADATKKVKAATKHGKLATSAKRVSRTPGRAASAKRGKKQPKIDPAVEATRARNRALWKSQEQEATSIELAKHGTLVDERARVRANIGMSWSNRKPR